MSAVSKSLYDSCVSGHSFSIGGEEGTEEKLMIVMVGLPARGKSFISKGLFESLSTLGIRTRVFNVGMHRRRVGGNENAEFFDHSNKAAADRREELARTVLSQALSWLRMDQGDVVIFDATNTTEQRRRFILQNCSSESDRDGAMINVLFVESICSDESILEKNILQKIRTSPDYADVPADEARNDFMTRIANYEKVYETITDDSLSYVKVVNLYSKVLCNRVQGRMQHQVLAFLFKLHNAQRLVSIVPSDPMQSESSEQLCFQYLYPLMVPRQSNPSTSKSPLSTAYPCNSSTPPLSGFLHRSHTAGSMDLDWPWTEFTGAFDHSEHAACDAESLRTGASDEDNYWSSFHGRASWQRHPGAHFTTWTAMDMLAAAL